MFKYVGNHFYCLNLYVRLLVFITLAFSLLMSSIIYIILDNIQKYLIIDYISFIKNLVAVFTSYVLSITQLEVVDYLKTTVEQIYLAVPDLQYIMLLKGSDSIILFYPETEYLTVYENFKSCLMTDTLHILPNLYNQICQVSYMSEEHSMQIIHIAVPVTDINNQDVYLYTELKYNINSIFISSSVQWIILSVFLAIWLICIIAIILNFLIVQKSTLCLSEAINKLAAGNFQTRIVGQYSFGLVDIVADFNDMAERLEMYEKNNVEQLILEKSKLETLVSIIADGVILLDKELRIIFINQSASKIFKFLKSCIIGTYLSNYLPHDINEQLMPMLKEIIKRQNDFTQNSNTKNLNLRLKSDSTKTLHLVITAVLDAECQVLTGVGIIIQDITNQIGLNEAKTQFISNVSHELRTPLFNIRSFLETLSEYRDSLTEKQKVEFLEIANQETQRLTCLVNDVLDLSRLESDFLDLLELIEFHEIVPPVIQTSQLRAKNKKVQLCFQICPQVFTVNGYPNLITQVLSNLIGNSLKFTGIDGRILLKVYSVKLQTVDKHISSNKIRIEIIDEGTGIDEFDQNRIFDRFVRLENNVHTLEGTGLGLSIVKNIVEKHKSHIHVYSELGLGSSFWFDLYMLEKKN
uniref:Uncharacterized sensor-like histidine kinase ycf26 n=1 Tax=Liagoropsis maxima TaxID=1653392 RepID=A0A1G4NW27_9FLOR|nr:Drug sensory protein A [Liagoropsis maxima]SCW22716.1 Drug sensory protein A [Liagoropsis maxima]